MKKLLAIIMAAAMLIGCVGCGSDAKPVDAPVTTTTTGAAADTDTTADTTTSTTITTSTTETEDTTEATESTTAADTDTTAAQPNTTRVAAATAAPQPVNQTTKPKVTMPPLTTGSGASYSWVKNPFKASISARNAVVYDETHGLILYSKNIDGKCAPASITKVLTAIVAVQKLSLDTKMTVGSEQDMVAGAASRAFISRGSTYTLRTLLEALLIPSGCDAAYTIAVNVARKTSKQKLSDREALNLFVRYMNQTAQNIGATHSSFKCPDGFPTSGHYTTVRDLLTIARKARTYSSLTSIMSKPTSSNGRWFGTNALIKSYSAYYYKGADGMKTGTSDEAGNCVMASAQKKGVRLIVIVMGSSYRYEDAVTLLNKGFDMGSKITTTKKTTTTTKKKTTTTKKPTTTTTKKPTTTTTHKPTTTTTTEPHTTVTTGTTHAAPETAE